MAKAQKEKTNAGSGKKIISKVLAIIIVLAGIGMAAWPLFATYVNSKSAESTVNAYNETVRNLTDEEIEEMERQAAEYNAALAYNVSIYGTQDEIEDAFSSGSEGSDEYKALLNADGSGVMGYIDIPSINVYYPIYHGTSDSVLSAGIGHMAGSSLPVGGENTHAVLTGHTGITTNKLFTDLDELSEGDIFYIHVLGKILAYEVTEIQVVLPSETDALLIREGEDLVTLVTCTPYGINSHRLFITGTRVEYSEEAYEAETEKGESSSSLWMDEYIKALLTGVLAAFGVLFVIVIIRLLTGKGKEKKGKIPWRVIFGIIIMIAGIGIYSWPSISEFILSRMTDNTIFEFKEEYGTEDVYAETAESADREAELNNLLANDALWDACVSYNQAIYRAGQNGLSSSLAYEKSQITLSVYDGFDEDSAFGYIEIPAMDVTLPLYLGATTQHMALGAAVMGQTSVPVGGENTNSVIVGHRGYRGSPYFREIETLSVGDYVYITNPWGTLAYRVTGTDIIDPHDSESIKIQEGKDMITLLTCHPYRSHGKYRWIVLCERDTDEEARPAAGGEKQAVEEEPAEEIASYITASDGATYATSEADIRRENFLRAAAGIAIVVIVLLSALNALIRKFCKEKKGKAVTDEKTPKEPRK